jgi:hypothetical protein
VDSISAEATKMAGACASMKPQKTVVRMSMRGILALRRNVGPEDVN